MIFAEESSNILKMFTNISWAEYSIFILIAVFIYYLIILVIFYKGEIFNLVNNLQLLHKRSNHYNTSDSSEKIESDLLSVNTESSDDIIQLQEEIQSQLERAKLKKSIKEEIIMSLQLVFRKYSSINQSQYKDSINHYIKDTSENICSIHLNDQEVEQVWFR